MDIPGGTKVRAYIYWGNGILCTCKYMCIAHYVVMVVIEEEKKGRKPRTNTPHTNCTKKAQNNRTPGYMYM